MFGRTRYGKEIDALAVRISETMVTDTSRDGGVDADARKMPEQIKAGGDFLPDVSTALKKNGGKSR